MTRVVSAVVSPDGHVHGASGRRRQIVNRGPAASHCGWNRLPRPSKLGVRDASRPYARVVATGCGWVVELCCARWEGEASRRGTRRPSDSSGGGSAQLVPYLHVAGDFIPPRRFSLQGVDVPVFPVVHGGPKVLLHASSDRD